MRPQPLHGYRRAAMRMLSSLGLPTPNPTLGSLHRTMKPTSETSKFPFFTNPKIAFSNSYGVAQTLTSGKCFSANTIAIPSVSEYKSDCELNGSSSEAQLVVVSFYKFADFPDHADLRKPLKELCEQLRVSGGIILAPEGINGSICGTRDSVERVLAFIQSDNRLKGLRQVESPVSPEEEAIHHGHMSSSPLAAGEDAPFRWDHVRVKLKKEVYHLEGGILKYLEEVPKKESLWEGECFVFDKRVSVDHGLVQGTFKLCYGCKQPVSDADMEAPEWEYGVSCPYCYSSKSEEEKERARARQRQFERWGIIGGPDKGRRPVTMVDGNEKNATQMARSV